MNLNLDHLNLNLVHRFPILVYLLIALAVTRLPYLRVYFSLCNTLLHELIRAILEGGMKSKVYLNKNASGNESMTPCSPLKKTLILYAGYTGTSLAAVGLFYLVAHQQYYLILCLFIGLFAVSSILWIRNFFGIIWALSFALLLAVLVYFQYDSIIMHVSIILASFILIQSIINGLHLCGKTLLERKNHARTGIFAKFKLIPALMLGVVLLAQSLYTGYFIVTNILTYH